MLKDDNTQKLPGWIKDYRDQSWQMEILIAGGTVFTLFSLADFFQLSFYRIYPSIHFSIYRTLALFGVYLVTRILLFGFAANLILRAVWLAYLGINFSFPDGLNYKKLKSNQESKDQLKASPNILNRLISLEKLCNLSYSLAVLLAIFATSIFISMIFITWVLDYIGFHDIVDQAVFSYTLSFIIGIIQLGWLDRILFTKKSKSEKLNNIKEFISQALGIITLSFLFRRELLVIKTNTNRYLLVFFITLFLGLSTIVSAIQIGRYWPYGTLNMKILDDKKFYDLKYAPRVKQADYESNFMADKVAFRACIQSEIIQGRYLKLFLVSWRQFDYFLEKTFEKKNYIDKIDKKLSYQKRLVIIDKAENTYSEVIDELFDIEIADSLYKDLKWKKHKHPITKENGYLTYIDINELSPSAYDLKIFVNYYEDQDSLVKGRWTQIPFWRE